MGQPDRKKRFRLTRVVFRLLMAAALVAGISTVEEATVAQSSSTTTKTPSPVTEATPAAPAEPASQIGDPGKWHMRSGVALLDDGRWITLALNAEQTIRAWPGVNHLPQLVIQCHEDRISLKLVTGTPTHPEFRSTGSTVTIRFDDAEAENFKGVLAADHQSVQLPEPHTLIRRLAAAERVVVGFRPLYTSSVATTFDVRGLEHALRPLEEVSGWRLHDPVDILSRRLLRISHTDHMLLSFFRYEKLTFTYGTRHPGKGSVSRPAVETLLGYLREELAQDPTLRLRITAYGVKKPGLLGALLESGERRLNSAELRRLMERLVREGMLPEGQVEVIAGPDHERDRFGQQMETMTFELLTPNDDATLER